MLLFNQIYYRFFWITILLILFWNIIVIFTIIINRFLSESISIGIETTFLYWDNTFPAVSFCIGKKRFQKPLDDYLKQHNISYGSSITSAIRDYIYISPVDVVLKFQLCKTINATCGVDIISIREKLLPRSCKDFVKSVTILGKSYFNCEEVFKFFELEMGYCFLSNSIFYYGSYDKLPYKYVVSQVDRSFMVVLEGNPFWKYQVYVHSPEEYPNSNSKGFDIVTNYTHLVFDAYEILNNDNMIEEHMKNRKCRYMSEPMIDIPYHYSFSACMTSLRINMELKYCNCTIFTSPPKYSRYYCDIDGLSCLNRARIQEKIKSTFGNNFICYPSCEEQHIILIGYTNQNFGIFNSGTQKHLKEGNMYIKIEPINVPSLRYSRVLTLTLLDVIVSIGGIFGLFIGTSILHILELFYFYLRRYLT